MKILKVRTAVSSIGLAIPFHPCMQDEKTIATFLKTAADELQRKMHRRYDETCINSSLTRLEKLFNRLNYNSHRKSVAVILTPDEEKITYLNFPVKPVTYLNKYVSLLELTANAEQQPDFYILVFRENKATLYEWLHNRLHKVFETNQEPRPDEMAIPGSGLFKQVSQTIELLNSKTEKPVIVTGSPNVVEAFSNSEYYSKAFFTFLYETVSFDEEIIQSLSKEISSHWNYWHSKFITSRLLMAQAANSLITNVDSVLAALKKCTDGLLLLDKRLKRQLYKSRRINAFFNKADELMDQVDEFLTRGNRIIVTETGLLKNFGGIVMVQNNSSKISDGIQSQGKMIKADTY